jgi:DNA-binding IclR family transcriptional regulator
MNTGERGKYQVRALERALDVLYVVAEVPDLPLQEVARRCRTSPSQTLKIVSTLERRGLIVKGVGKTYRLGYAAIRLGYLASALRPVVQAAASELERLRSETQESVHLVVREGLETVIADVRESPQAVRIVAEVGKCGALHAGASGKLFLAFGEPELLAAALREPLRVYTRGTLTDPEAVREVVRRVRSEGVCVARGDYEEGAFSVAAPIFDRAGVMAASVAVAGPLSRLDGEREARYRELVLDAARIIGRKLI